MPGVSQLDEEGYTVPAFTFEKILPPSRRGPTPPVANKKQRGVMVRMLDRFVEARARRARRDAAKAAVVARARPSE